MAAPRFLPDMGRSRVATVTSKRSQGLVKRLAGLAFELTPQVFAVACFVVGASILASAATPAFAHRLAVLDRALHPLLIDLSHFGASVAGFLLLALSAGLWRRRRGAYWATLIVLIGAAALSLLKGLDWEEALELGAVAVLLAPCRAAFNRRSVLTEPLHPAWLLRVGAAVAAIVWLGFFVYRDVTYQDELWWTFLTDREVSGFLRAAAVLAGLTVLVAGRSLLSAPGLRGRRCAAPEEVARAIEILRAGGGRAEPEAWLAALGDKALMFSPSGRSFLTYRVIGRRWIAMGEPAGAVEERRELLWAFAEAADGYGAAPVFYSVGEGLLADLATLGLAVRKIGETAAVDTAAFSLEGKARQNLRTAVNRAEREGAVFEMLPPGAASAVAAELKAVSDAWLTAHRGTEKAFSLGRFDPAYLDLMPLAVVRASGRIVAFANLMPGGRPADGLAVDLMRHAPDAPPGVMDYLFVRAIQWARDQGWAFLDLGLAPLAGLDDRRLSPVFARVGALVFDEGEAVYGFSGLRAYKAKFAPDWRPRFIAAPPSTPLALALLDVALLTSGGWRGMLRGG